MSEERIPKATVKRIYEIRNITDTKSALEPVVDLTENYASREKRVPVKYNKNTGEPIDYEWKSSKNWRTFKTHEGLRFYPDSGIHLMLRPELSEIVLKKIEKSGPFLVYTQHGAYFFAYEEPKDVSCPSSIYIRKVNKVL